jgi:hypothetical protein
MYNYSRDKIAERENPTTHEISVARNSMIHATTRVVDADIIQDYLIEQALDDGVYDHLVAKILADGYALPSHELAPRSYIWNP